MPRWVFRYVGNKTFDFSSKKMDFLPKNDQIWPETGIFGQFGPGHAGLFNALLVGRLVVVGRGLYLARHLFTLYIIYIHLWSKNLYSYKYWHENISTEYIFEKNCSTIDLGWQERPLFGRAEDGRHVIVVHLVK